MSSGRNGQRIARGRSAAVIGVAHGADATRTPGGPLLCRRRRCVTGFQALGSGRLRLLWASTLASRALEARSAAR